MTETKHCPEAIECSIKCWYAEPARSVIPILSLTVSEHAGRHVFVPVICPQKAPCRLGIRGVYLSLASICETCYFQAFAENKTDLANKHLIFGNIVQKLLVYRITWTDIPG